MVLEAMGAGVIASRLSHIVEKYDGALELWTSNEVQISSDGKLLDRERIVDAARLHLGKQYSKWKLVLALRKLFLGTDERADPQRPPRAFMCAEYVSVAWKAGGVDLSRELDRYTAPRDIARSGYVRRVGALQPSPRREDGTSVHAEALTIIPDEPGPE